MVRKVIFDRQIRLPTNAEFEAMVDAWRFQSGVPRTVAIRAMCEREAKRAKADRSRALAKLQQLGQEIDGAKSRKRER